MVVEWLSEWNSPMSFFAFPLSGPYHGLPRQLQKSANRVLFPETLGRSLISDLYLINDYFFHVLSLKLVPTSLRVRLSFLIQPTFVMHKWWCHREVTPELKCKGWVRIRESTWQDDRSLFSMTLQSESHNIQNHFCGNKSQYEQSTGRHGSSPVCTSLTVWAWTSYCIFLCLTCLV